MQLKKITYTSLICVVSVQILRKFTDFRIIQNMDIEIIWSGSGHSVSNV